VSDHACLATTHGQADLGQLSGFARSGLATDDYNLMAFNGLPDLISRLSNRQRGIKADFKPWTWGIGNGLGNKNV
jgi:hypothetical protein